MKIQVVMDEWIESKDARYEQSHYKTVVLDIKGEVFRDIVSKIVYTGGIYAGDDSEFIPFHSIRFINKVRGE